MKRIKIIENPSSGLQQSGKNLSLICEKLLNAGFELGKFRTRQKEDGYYEAIHSHKSNWDMIIVSGGDGTVNEVINGLSSVDSKIPVAIHSRGTVNDFASFMNIPTEVDDFVHMIENPVIKTIDLGRSDDKYFVNVAACGNFANVGHQTDKHLKAVFGRFAYLVEGFKEIPSTLSEPMKLTLEMDGQVLKEEAYLIILSNTTTVGGFEKIAPNASLYDGKLDLILFRKTANLQDLAQMFIKTLAGEHISKESVLYLQTSEVKVYSEEKTPVDIDGEFNGYLPKTFSAKKGGINIITSP